MLIKSFSEEEILELIKKSEKSPRKRAVKVFHPKEEKGMRMMLNCLQQGTYVQPHSHPSKDGNEIWIPYQGRIASIIFTDEGNLDKYFILSQNESRFLEILPRTWHTAIAMEPNSIMYEFSNGPYKTQVYKEFASWAPAEGENETAEYLKNLCKQLKI